MEWQSSAVLLQTGRRVTRLQCRLIREVLPFLELPPELRVMIYQICFDFSGIEKYFDQLHKVLANNRSVKCQKLLQAKAPRMTTPTIFLINKQIYQEASFLLQKETINFHHGLLTDISVSSVISPNVLCQISTINITDDGHPIIKRRLLPESWGGYMRLITELGIIMAKNHKLKKFAINFSDKRLKEHMVECVANGHDCGFRDQMHAAIATLCEVRGVKEVTLNGIIAQQAEEMRKLLQKPRVGFGELPRELRDMIYEQAMDWSDISKSLVRAMANWPDQKRCFPYPRKTTPTVLLLNKQYSDEALEVLHKKPLNILFPGNHSITHQPKIPKITRFISRKTIQSAKMINIHMESWEWVYNFDRNFVTSLAASKNLQKLRLYFKDNLKSLFLCRAEQQYPDGKLHSVFKELATIRGLQLVDFKGDLPQCYTNALEAFMMSTPTTDQQLPIFRAVSGSGDIVDISSGDEDSTS